MQDIEHGRLFRLSKKGGKGSYMVTAPDFSTPESATLALRSPNHATRYLAWTALNNFGDLSVPALTKMTQDDNPRFRARALWVLGKLDIPTSNKVKFIVAAFRDKDADVQVAASRLSVQLQTELVAEDIQPGNPLNQQTSPELFRETLISLRQWPIKNHAEVWADIADHYESGDRWFLEALGIAAEGHWDECLDAWAGNDLNKLMTPEGKDIVWRSRGTKSAEWLAKAIADDQTIAKNLARYFRAFDFVTSADKSRVLADLAFGDHRFESEKAEFVLMESASRLNVDDLTKEQTEKLGSLIDQSRGTPQFISLVDKFSSQKHYPELLNIAASNSDRQMAADAMRVLLGKNQAGSVHTLIVKSEPETREIVCNSLVNSGQRRADRILSGIAKRTELDSELRTYAIKRLGETKSGAGDMLAWINNKEHIDPTIMPAIQAALHGARWNDVKQKANELFPIAATKGNKPLPPMNKLVGRRGDVANGQKVFEAVGTCGKCHVVAGKGIEVGPDLSEIGNKLTKLAMYESILFPSAGISHNYENWMVLKDDGQMITGVLLGDTESEIQLMDDKGIKHVIRAGEIEEKKQQRLSLMPADLHKEMSVQELVDLVEYMATLKKKSE